MFSAIDEFRQRIQVAVASAKTKDMDSLPLYDDHAHPPPMWTLVRRKLDLSRFPLPDVRFVTVGITPTASCRSARVNVCTYFHGALMSGLQLVKGRSIELSTEPDAAIIQTLYHREPWFEDADSGAPVTDIELVGCLCPTLPPGRFHIRIGDSFHEYGENAEILRVYSRALVALHQC